MGGGRDSPNSTMQAESSAAISLWPNLRRMRKTKGTRSAPGTAEVILNTTKGTKRGLGEGEGVSA